MCLQTLLLGLVLVEYDELSRTAELDEVLRVLSGWAAEPVVDEWTGAELLYALVFTFTLFIFLDSVAYLYFFVSEPESERFRLIDTRRHPRMGRFERPQRREIR